MYAPTRWPRLAQWLKQADDLLANASSPALHSEKSFGRPGDWTFRRQPALNETDPAPDYSFQAITCADAVDAGDVTTQIVFESLVTVTREVSQMCKSDSRSLCYLIAYLLHAVGPMWGDVSVV